MSCQWLNSGGERYTSVGAPVESWDIIFVTSAYVANGSAPTSLGSHKRRYRPRPVESSYEICQVRLRIRCENPL